MNYSIPFTVGRANNTYPFGLSPESPESAFEALTTQQRRKVIEKAPNVVPTIGLGLLGIVAGNVILGFSGNSVLYLAGMPLFALGSIGYVIWRLFYSSAARLAAKAYQT